MITLIRTIKDYWDREQSNLFLDPATRAGLDKILRNILTDGDILGRRGWIYCRIGGILENITDISEFMKTYRNIVTENSIKLVDDWEKGCQKDKILFLNEIDGNMLQVPDVDQKTYDFTSYGVNVKGSFRICLEQIKDILEFSETYF